MLGDGKTCGEPGGTCGLFLAAQAVIGFGAGVLLGHRIAPGRRGLVAGVAISLGAAASVPLVVEFVTRRVRLAQTSRNQRRRLRSIREGEGFNHEPTGL